VLTSIRVITVWR